MENENFKKDLDELFRLFNKLIKDRPIEDVPGLNQGMLRQFEFFFSNYENMKDQISQQLQGQFGEPVKEMVKVLIKQLKDELDEDEFMETIEEEDDQLILDDEIQKIEGKSEREKIDELLKTPGLTEEQIDELLDRRSNL